MAETMIADSIEYRKRAGLGRAAYIPGDWLIRECPACGQLGAVGIYPGRLLESARFISSSDWICATCQSNLAEASRAWDIQDGYGHPEDYAQMRQAAAACCDRCVAATERQIREGR